ncbi:hypothetical protein ACWEFJ_15945 [Actinosynnema sp. NPDC004786]
MSSCLLLSCLLLSCLLLSCLLLSCLLLSCLLLSCAVSSWPVSSSGLVFRPVRRGRVPSRSPARRSAPAPLLFAPLDLLVVGENPGRRRWTRPGFVVRWRVKRRSGCSGSDRAG